MKRMICLLLAGMLAVSMGCAPAQEEHLPEQMPQKSDTSAQDALPTYDVLLPTLPEGREINLLGRSAVPDVPGGNGWYYLPVTDFTWYPRSQFWDEYERVLEWLTSKAVFTLY